MKDTDLYEFGVTIYSYKGVYTIQYGDPYNVDGPCIEFTYDTMKPSILKLDNLQYKNTCSIEKKGEGTIYIW